MLKLRIIAPDRLVFDGEVESVTLPGTVGTFSVLNNHAAIITSLDKGFVVYKGANGSGEVAVKSGFAEVTENILSICVEL